MAALFVKTLEQVGQLHKTDDDFSDRLNHRFTVILLVTFTAFISTKQLVGEPISCWSPPQFSGPQIAYTNSICWLKGTYYLETDRRLIPHRTQNSEFRIAYYQFMPYILLVMALLFYLPHMLWRNLSRYFGFDLRAIIQDMRNLAKIDIHQIAQRIHASLESNSLKYPIDHRKNHVNHFLGIFVFRNRLSLLYIFVKILYVINGISQFHLLSIFLSFSFHRFGYQWLLMTLTTIPTDDSRFFPRVVMCDFMVRHLGSNQHWMSVQCNLPINLFNELIFLIIWTWLIVLISLSCISLLLCIISIYTTFGHRFIRQYLHMSIPKLNEDRREVFINDYLQWDGILVLRIISQNTNDVVMSHMIKALFNFHSNSMKKEYLNDDDQLQSSGHYMRIDSSSI